MLFYAHLCKFLSFILTSLKKTISYLLFKGDSSMCLPYLSYDKNELVKGISKGPDTQIEAKEYLKLIDDSPARQLNMSTVSGH